MILRSSAVPDKNLPQSPRSAARQKLSADRAARIAKREQAKIMPSSNESKMDVDEDTNLPKEQITADAAVQVDTMEMDKLLQGRRRDMAIVFKTDAELNSWTGLNSIKMLDTIEQSIQSFSA